MARISVEQNSQNAYWMMVVVMIMIMIVKMMMLMMLMMMLMMIMIMMMMMVMMMIIMIMMMMMMTFCSCYQNYAKSEVASIAIQIESYIFCNKLGNSPKLLSSASKMFRRMFDSVHAFGHVAQYFIAIFPIIIRKTPKGLKSGPKTINVACLLGHGESQYGKTPKLPQY